MTVNHGLCLSNSKPKPVHTGIPLVRKAPMSVWSSMTGERHRWRILRLLFSCYELGFLITSVYCLPQSRTHEEAWCERVIMQEFEPGYQTAVSPSGDSVWTRVFLYIIIDKNCYRLVGNTMSLNNTHHLANMGCIDCFFLSPWMYDIFRSNSFH